MPIIAAIFVFSAVSRGLYNTLPRYASVRDLIRLTESVGMTCVAMLGISYISVNGQHLLPLSVAIIAGPIALLLLGGVHLSDRLVGAPTRKEYDGRERILIVGAGDAGEMLARDMLRNTHTPFTPVGFIDDDPHKQRLTIHGLPILGQIDQIPEAVKGHDAKTVLVAMPSVPSRVVRKALDKIAETGARAKIVPAIHEIVGETITTADIRDVDISDLIGREPVELLTHTISERIAERSVLITGAAGSIGSELARQILRFGPQALLLLDNDETEVYELWQSLANRRSDGANIKMIVADIRDGARMSQVLSQNAPDIVFHAAAHKHVSVMESHPSEAVLTNVLGTRNVAEAAAKAGVERFVLVSTDKAVAPSGVMGASKRGAELVVAACQQTSGTRFSSVRFGNVIGSRGSVVPVFRRQIAAGGPITVTHADATRYFMTIDEAASLIIQAAALSSGGETFLLDMGEPVRILDLAEKMRAVLAHADRDRIQIVFTGLRQGEKLHEELVNPGEAFQPSLHPSILVTRDALGSSVRTANDRIRRLIALAERHGDPDEIRSHLFNLSREPREIHLDRPTTLPAG